MRQLAATISESVENGHAFRLNAIVAISVSVTATFTALCRVKDGNRAQAMAQAQADAIDAWSYCQAKGTKRGIAESAGDELLVERDLTPNLTADARALFGRKREDHAQKITHCDKEKVEIEKTAEGHQHKDHRLNSHDDRFDMAEATLSIAIALFGVTALTQKRAVLVVALAFAGSGTRLGLSGFLELSLHPDFLARLLG